MKHRQIGEAEATYRLLPSLTLSMSNVTCQFAATGLKEERSSRFRRATEEQINAGLPCIELKNHEGLWYEQDDMWSKFLRRPSVVKDLCFAQFCRMYVTWSPSKKESEEDKLDEEEAFRKVWRANVQQHLYLPLWTQSDRDTVRGILSNHDVVIDESTEVNIFQKTIGNLHFRISGFRLPAYRI